MKNEYIITGQDMYEARQREEDSPNMLATAIVLSAVMLIIYVGIGYWIVTF